MIRAKTTRIKGKCVDTRILESDKSRIIVQTVDGVQNTIKVLKWEASK